MVKGNYVFQVSHICNDLKHTFRSKCLSSRVRASVSPPGHTAEGRPSVSKPEKQIKTKKFLVCLYCRAIKF